MNNKRETLNYIYENFDDALQKKNAEIKRIKEMIKSGRVFVLCSDEVRPVWFDICKDIEWLKEISVTNDANIDAEYVIRNPVEYFRADLNYFDAHIAGEISGAFDFLPDPRSWDVMKKKIHLSFMTQEEMKNESMSDVLFDENEDCDIVDLDLDKIIKKKNNEAVVGVIVDKLEDLINGSKLIARRFVGTPMKLRYLKGHTLIIF